MTTQISRLADKPSQKSSLIDVARLLFRHRPQWGACAAVGTTIVTTGMIDRIAAKLGRRLYEVPVGFKWFSAGLLDGTLGFGGEESAGATFLRRAGSVWTTDKDGIIAALLCAEISARGGRDLGLLYGDLTTALGNPTADRVQVTATAQQKQRLAAMSAHDVKATDLAGEKIDRVIDHAPGNDAPIGGIKVSAASGWFAARPSGTEDIYKIYAESFRGPEPLRQILKEAQHTVDPVLRQP
jgi:phosphoglucomutase